MHHGTENLDQSSQNQHKKLRKFSNKYYDENNKKQCAICLNDLTQNDGVVGELPCQHEFDFNCIQQWFGYHHTCPICRTPLTYYQKVDYNFENPNLIIYLAEENIEQFALENDIESEESDQEDEQQELEEVPQQLFLAFQIENQNLLMDQEEENDEEEETAAMNINNQQVQNAIVMAAQNQEFIVRLNDYHFDIENLDEMSLETDLNSIFLYSICQYCSMSIYLNQEDIIECFQCVEKQCHFQCYNQSNDIQQQEGWICNECKMLQALI